MKNKTSLYILFPVVVLIWGLVIWRVVGAFSEESVPFPQSSGIQNKPIEIIKRDTFSLVSVERDPFLDIPLNKENVPIKTGKVVKPEVIWPSITYLGQVSDTKISSRVYVIKINEQQYILGPGGEAEGVKLLKVKGEKVSLVYQGSRKEFIKGN